MYIYTNERYLRLAGCEELADLTEGRKTVNIGEAGQECQIRPALGPNGWYVVCEDRIMTDIEADLPEAIKQLAVSYSFRESGIWIGKRKPGMYYNGTAKARVMFNTNKRELWEHVTSADEAIHDFEITCTDLQDGQELHRLLLTGQILPQDGSFLEPQMDAPETDDATM